MNFRNSLAEIQGSTAYNVDFNEDCSYFTVATDDGVKIYESESCDLQRESDTDGPVGGATMLGSTQVVGVRKGGVRTSNIPKNALVLQDVGGSRQSPTTITVSADQSKGGPILRSCMTQSHIVIVCERSVRIYHYKFSNGAQDFDITKVATYETCANPLGLCCLRAKQCVFPGRSKGQIMLVDLASGADNDSPEASIGASSTFRKNRVPNVSIVPAHNAALRAITLTSDGTIVASASETGTLIRLHHTPTQARLSEYRRGIQTSTIYSLAFSPSSSYLAVTSDTNTLHIFAIGGRNEKTKDSNKRNSSASPSHSPSNLATSSANATPQSSWVKWPTLSKLPFAPRVFSDVYSIATCAFEPGAKDVEGVQPPKGVVGWTDDETLVVLSAGRDARYERFAFDVGGANSSTASYPASGRGSVSPQAASLRSGGVIQQTGVGGFADARVGSDEVVPASVWRIGWMRFMRPN